MPSSPSSPRILITRLSHIGDCVLTLPLLNAIRSEFPQAYIGWAVESPSQQLLSLHPGIDQLILVPKAWAKKPRCWRQLARDLRQPKFEIVIDPQGITKSAALGRLSGAKKRIGIRGRWGRELSPYLNNRLVETSSAHLVDRSLELLSAMGIEKPAVEFQLPACTESTQRMKQFLAMQKLNRTFAVMNPGASWASKRWVTERFAPVADHLFQQHGIPTLLTWAGPHEKKMVQRIHELEPNATTVAPATSLRELAALCQQASFFLGCDTGPLHIATAMGTACVGLYGTTRPEESGAYGMQHVAVQKWYQPGSCRERRSAPNTAMQAIEAADVILAVDQMVTRIDPSGIQAPTVAVAVKVAS